MGDPLRIEALRDLAALAPWRERIDALNLASRSPSLFGTLSFIERYLAHDEYADPRVEPLFLLALEGEALVGFVALRRVRARLAGLPADRIEFLVVHDVERPRMACRPEDEARCAEAFLAHLVERERGWSMVQLMEQDATSPLARAADARAGRLYVRRFENLANATITCRWPDAGAYYRELSKSFRASLRQHLNRHVAEGRVEFVSSWAPAATARLLDVHLDLEARSWKGPAMTGLSRHPVRVAFFRALLDQPDVRWGYRVMLLDGLPIASELNAEHAGTWYGFETVYDEAYRDLGSGHLLFLMSMREALAEGARAVNLLNNFAYVKRRYLADVTETAAVQLYRPGSPLWLKARAGELRRRFARGGPSQADADYNLTKGKAEPGVADEARRTRPDRTDARRRAAALLEGCGAALERLDVGVLQAILGQAPAGPGQARPRAPRPPARPGTAP